MFNRVLGLGAVSALVFTAYTMAPAAAATSNPTAAPSRFASGQFTGTYQFTFSPTCPVHQNQTTTTVGTANPAYSATTLLDICIDVSTDPFIVTGTFVSTYGNGATLTGTILGVATPSDFSGTETVTGGTGQFSHVTGTIDYSGTAGPGTLQVTSVAHLTYNNR